MAIIYTYPTKNATASDKILISDSEDELKTKQAPVSSIKDAIDVVDSITATSPIIASSLTGNVNISSTPYSGGNNVGHVPIGGTNSTFLKGDGTWGSSPGVTPGAPLNSIQFNSGSSFAGDPGFIFTNTFGVPKLTIGETSDDQGGMIEIQSDENGGVLRIGGGSQMYYTSIKGSENDTASYDIILPTAGPGGNNKILQSDSTGQLYWINSPSTYVLPAATQLNLGGVKTGYVPPGSAPRNYALSIDSQGNAFANVPWTDNNTTDITLTTTGTSGASTWNGTTLNIPQYSSSTPAGANEGFNTFTIYDSTSKIGPGEGEADYTSIRQSVCDRDCEIGFVDFFRFTGTSPVSVFVYAGDIINGGTLVLSGTQAPPNIAPNPGVNTIIFKNSEGDPVTQNFAAGDDIVVVVSFKGGGAILAGSKSLISDPLISRYNNIFFVPDGFTNPNPPDSDLNNFLAETGSGDPTDIGAALHFYNKD